jgi:preprotein translocase subunit SecY
VLNALFNVFKIPELRVKVLWTLFFLAVFRLGSQIPIPGIDVSQLVKLREQFAGGWLALVSAFTGGALGNSAIFSLGIMPYISSSIIFSLLTKIIPSLEALSKEGAAGQRKINQWTRYATVPICILQALFVCRMMSNPQNWGGLVLVPDPSGTWYLMAVTVLTAGGVLLIWVGEQITEYGIGNGISLLISIGIISQMPSSFAGIWMQRGALVVIVLFIVYCMVVAGVVLIVQGQRRIPVQQAKHTRGRRVYGGQKHFIPIRVNMAGVMPVIFAESLLIFPTVILSWANLSGYLSVTSFWRISIYTALVFFFTFFWTSLMFQPKEMANNMKEYGSFIPGIRPGARTAEYLERIMVNVSVAGAAFLAALGIFPQIMAGAVGLTQGLTSFLGGTGLLIVVGVTLDFVQKIESHLLMRHYEGFMKKGRVRGRRWGGGGW